MRVTDQGGIGRKIEEKVESILRWEKQYDNNGDGPLEEDRTEWCPKRLDGSKKARIRQKTLSRNLT